MPCCSQVTNILSFSFYFHLTQLATNPWSGQSLIPVPKPRVLADCAPLSSTPRSLVGSGEPQRLPVRSMPSPLTDLETYGPVNLTLDPKAGRVLCARTALIQLSASTACPLMDTNCLEYTPPRVQPPNLPW